MSKRIVYQKSVYVRVGNHGDAVDAQVKTIARAAVMLARSLDTTYSLEDNLAEVLALVQESARQQLAKR